jgi:hypothetical protein
MNNIVVLVNERPESRAALDWALATGTALHGQGSQPTVHVVLGPSTDTPAGPRYVSRHWPRTSARSYADPRSNTKSIPSPPSPPNGSSSSPARSLPTWSSSGSGNAQPPSSCSSEATNATSSSTRRARWSRSRSSSRHPQSTTCAGHRPAAAVAPPRCHRRSLDWWPRCRRWARGCSPTRRPCSARCSSRSPSRSPGSGPRGRRDRSPGPPKTCSPCASACWCAQKPWQHWDHTGPPCSASPSPTLLLSVLIGLLLGRHRDVDTVTGILADRRPRHRTGRRGPRSGR